MKFSHVIKSIVDEDGAEALVDPGIIGRISSCDGFEETAKKHIYQVALQSRCMARFVASGEWDDVTRRMIERFVIFSGFRSDLVYSLFEDIGRAIGYGEMPESPDITDDSGQVCEPQEGYSQVTENPNPQWRDSFTHEGKAEFVTRLIEVDRELDRQTGCTVTGAACVRVSAYSVDLSFELRRLEPRATGALYYAIYEMNGRVIDTGIAGAITLHDGSRLPVMINLKCSPSRLKQIFLFWK
ncbi:MAG: hypothetical protein ACI30D_00165 [Muribaculaceae bacterium]